MRARAASGEGGAVAKVDGNAVPAPTIQSVERAVRILGLFTVNRPELTLSEITEHLQVSKPTAHRYAMALRHLRLLRYDRASATYTLGPQILTLAAAARAGLPIFSLAGPVMEDLSKATNETVVLSIWDGESPVVIRTTESTEGFVQISIKVGTRLDRFSTAQGRVFCALLDVNDVPGLALELRRDPDLAADLAATREGGIALNAPPSRGVRTLAAPVFDDGDIVAALAIVGTSPDVLDDADSYVALALTRAARSLSELLGSGSEVVDDGDGRR